MFSILNQSYQYTGKRIKEWRKEQGLTYEEAAGLLGVNSRRLGLYETGGYVPLPVQALLHLYLTLGISESVDLLKDGPTQ